MLQRGGQHAEAARGPNHLAGLLQTLVVSGQTRRIHAPEKRKQRRRAFCAMNLIEASDKGLYRYVFYGYIKWGYCDFNNIRGWTDPRNQIPKNRQFRMIS